MSRPKVAFFDFTSCEGCQLSKLNLEEDLLGILDLVEIVNFREAISDRRDDYEIAFVEGSISTPHCVERIHKIRRQATVLVALGACAHIGGVNAIRNRMNIDAVKEEVYGKDKYLFPSIKAQAVSDVVKVDFYVPGCPMDNQEFKRILSAILTGQHPFIPEFAVCVECKALTEVDLTGADILVDEFHCLTCGSQLFFLEKAYSYTCPKCRAKDMQLIQGEYW